MDMLSGAEAWAADVAASLAATAADALAGCQQYVSDSLAAARATQGSWLRWWHAGVAQLQWRHDAFVLRVRRVVA
jgi:hypothetical protein